MPPGKISPGSNNMAGSSNNAYGNYRNSNVNQEVSNNSNLARSIKPVELPYQQDVNYQNLPQNPNEYQSNTPSINYPSMPPSQILQQLNEKNKQNLQKFGYNTNNEIGSTNQKQNVEGNIPENFIDLRYKGQSNMDPNNQGTPNLNAFNNFQEERKIDNRETFEQISIPMNDQNQLQPVNAPFNNNNNEMQMNGNQLPQQPILNTNQYEFKNFNFNEMNISESGVLESNSNNFPNPTQKLTNQLQGNYNMNKQIKESVYLNQQAPTNQPTGNTNFTENKVENMANMMTDENSNYNQEETLNKSVKTSIIYNDPSKGLQNTENKNTNQITAENNVKLNQNPNSLIKNKLGLQVTNYNVRQFLLNEQVIR